jgi:2,4-dienoyl-CoA reductase-like NADH-dependent reductase (Old Yellow Enzyme family)
MNTRYQPLFEPLVLSNGITLKNRLVMAPMTNFASNNEDGTVTEEELSYYKARIDGVSMVVTAVAYVTPGGKGFHGEIGADNDRQILGLAQLAETIKSQGAKAVLQIFHGGKLCSPELILNGDLVSASAVAAEAQDNTAEKPVPRALEEAEIESIIHDFGEATRRAIEAGFDGVEIHGANGYLIQQFFSPYSNRRTDRWGGSLEKRMAFPLAVIDEVKKAVAAYAKAPFIVGYRFSPEEPETPGITMVETLELIDVLAEQGLQYIHVSLTDYRSKPRRGADPDRSRLEIIQEKVAKRVPVIGVGAIYSADEAVEALQSGVALVSLGRILIMDPDFVQKITNGQESEIRATLDTSDEGQKRLVMPEYMWQAIKTTPGWFPGVK